MTITDRSGGVASAGTPVMTDRRTGIMAGIAIKAPCKAASIAALTLSGEQTIDALLCVTGDRVLVKDQVATATNGIYVVSTGLWARATDFDSVNEIAKGTLVNVAGGGTTNGATLWEVSSPDPVTIDSSAITFVNVVTGTAHTVNVKDYGAVGDGVTDDAPSINAAIAAAYAAGISTVFVPSGTYRIASVPVFMKANICLLGEGLYSILKQGNAANLEAVVDFSGYLGGTVATSGSLRFLTVDANRANNTSNLSSVGPTYRAVYFGNTDYVTIDNCTIKSCPGFGIQGSGQHGLTVSNCTLTDSEAHQIFVVEVGGTSEGDCRLLNNKLDHQILVYGLSGVIISGNLIEGFLIGDQSAPMHVNVSGTGVTWVSGPNFSTVKTGMTLIADNGSVQAFVKTVNSSTSITLHATMGTHTNKLCIIGTDDLLGCGGIQRAIITNNIVREGASFGLSLFGGTSTELQNLIVSNNYMYRQGKQGFVLLSDSMGSIGIQNIQVLGNHVINCCQGGLAGDTQVNLCSYVVTIQDVDTVLLDNNFAQDDLSLTNCWLSVAGLIDKVILGQGNHQVGAQVDGVYQLAGSILQPVIATTVTIGDDVVDPTKLTVRTAINEDIVKLYGPSSTNGTFGFFGTTAYWQHNGGNIEFGTSTNHDASIRTNTTVRLKVAGDGQTTVRADVATPAAGSTSARLLFGTTAGFGIYYGSGAPTVSAAKGSLYLRSDGSGTGDRLYVNTNGSTTWTNVTTAA